MSPKRKFAFLRPEFFDIFGIPVWIFIIIISARALNNNELPTWAIEVLLIIAIIGLIIDGAIVIRTYLMKK